MVTAMAATTTTSDDVTYDFTDTSVWGTQTIVNTSEATAYTYNEKGEVSQTGVTFYFATTATVKWNGSNGLFFTGSKVDTDNKINYVKVNVPAGYAVDVTGKGGNARSRILGVSFTLGKAENLLTSENTSVTVTNSTEAAADLYMYQYNVDNPALYTIRVYNPAAVKKHKLTVNVVDGDGNALADATTTEVEEQDAYTFSLAKVIVKDGAFYVLKDSEGRTDFSETVTMAEDDITKTYTYVKDESIVGFKKFTGIKDAAASEGGCANYNKNANQYSLMTAEAGAYNAEMFIFSTKSAALRDCSMYIDGVSIAKYTDTGVKTFPFNLVSEATVQYGCEATSSNNIDYIIVRKSGDAVASQKVSVGADGKATFCPAYAMDFSATKSIAAYKAAISGTTAQMTRVNTVAAGEGVVLRSANGGAAEESVAVSNPVAANDDNAMVGVLEDTQLSQISGSNTLFYLNSTGFVKVPADGMTLAAGKAYLPVPTTVEAAAGNALSIVFEGELTGIESVKGNKAANDDSIYTLGGQRVAKPGKGVYVKNGKKVIF